MAVRVSLAGQRMPTYGAHFSGRVTLGQEPEMEKMRVCAIVITFHPEVEVLGNLTQLRPQVDDLVVVDNGSSAKELEPLRTLIAGDMGTMLIENGENLGIATALNIGVRSAIRRGAGWILLFDQDSCVTEGLADTMISGFVSSRLGDRLAILVPKYVDRRLGLRLPQNRVAAGGLEAAMTSGSLLRAETFERCGFFVDDLFIDGVDYEYSLRLRQRGYVIEECLDATLLHSPGTPRQHKLAGRRLFTTANYSPLRRYYQERNKIWIARRYVMSFPVFCLKLFWFSSKDMGKILVAETDKWKKVRFFLMGIFDGLRGRMGRLERS